MLNFLKRLFKGNKKECRDAKGRFTKGYQSGLKRDARGHYVKKEK